MSSKFVFRFLFILFSSLLTAQRRFWGLLLLLCGESIFGLLGVCVVSFILHFPSKAISCGLLVLLCGESVFVNVGCLCACLCFNLDISFIFFALNPLKRFRLDFFFFCARESFWSVFGVCVVSFYFLRFSPPKPISWDFSFFCVGGCLCACFCFDLDISFIFFALNPLKRFRLDFFFFCARESILVYFWCLRCFILFSSLFPPKAISWDFSFFCVGGSFLADVGYSICVVSFYFLRFCHLHPDFACWSSPRVGVGVGPNSLNLGLGLGFNPNPNPVLRGWGGVSPDSGTRGWGWG